MKQRRCELCGDIFTPTSGRQKCCNKPINKICVVCGKTFESKCARHMSEACDNPDCKYKVSHSHTNIFLKPRICKACGEEFKPSGTNQNYCKTTKTKNCEVCGTEFSYICDSFIPRTCSPVCQGLLAKQVRTKNLSTTKRICKWCGKEFTPREFRDEYCYDKHFKKCVICGNKFEVDVRNDKYVQTCSKECKGVLHSRNHDYEQGAANCKKTLIAKYGVDNAMSIPGVVDKIKKTCQDKYGTDWYMQTEEYRERVKQTDLEKYGVEHHLQSKDVIEKRISTLQSRYGEDVTNIFQVEEIKNKSKQTRLDKFGVEYITQSEEIREKIKDNNLNKYGETHPMKLPEFQQKAIETNIEKYGRRAYNQQHISNIQNWYRFIDNPRKFIESEYDSYPSTYQLSVDLGVDVSTIDTYLKKTDSVDCVSRGKSRMEIDICTFIHSLDSEIRVITNTRSIIDGYELDIYLPDYNFAIECNPTCTHNSSVPDPWGEQPKPRKYHQDKTDKCEEQGIFLMHIFGFDWTYKKDVILSMIRNKLKHAGAVIYARKCEVREVNGQDSITFLNNNHRQGAANSPVRLGLYYDGTLVSLMTFGHMRKTIGTNIDKMEGCWELVRFCSLLNTSVVGGASKLLKHFIKTYSPEAIRSFSDRAHTSGDLYQILGFKEVARADTGYVWVNVASDRAYHRVNAQKKNLKKFLKDDDIDLTKTEAQIMVEHGFVQVFDSGTITWEWNKD